MKFLMDNGVVNVVLLVVLDDINGVDDNNVLWFDFFLTDFSGTVRTNEPKANESAIPLG